MGKFSLGEDVYVKARITDIDNKGEVTTKYEVSINGSEPVWCSSRDILKEYEKFENGVASTMQLVKEIVNSKISITDFQEYFGIQICGTDAFDRARKLFSMDYTTLKNKWDAYLNAKTIKIGDVIKPIKNSNRLFWVLNMITKENYTEYNGIYLDTFEPVIINTSYRDVEIRKTNKSIPVKNIKTNIYELLNEGEDS